jgi:transposase-like protein
MNTQPAATAAPKACPFCSSANITTTSKEVNASTYWRCAGCGQIWNAGRLTLGRRLPSGRYV